MPASFKQNFIDFTGNFEVCFILENLSSSTAATGRGVAALRSKIAFYFFKNNILN